MFVTVEKRVARIYHQDMGARLVIRLVRSFRDGSRVRRETVAYLGSIHEKRLPHPLPRQHFWDHATAAIDRLSWLGTDQRAQVLDQVRRVVPQPTDAEVAEAREGLKHWGQTLRAMLSRR